ncbi:hypothetical protein [Paludisphaera mucosa]|uniref:Uncharacterized protein n=1 Tax=Paludisphaera mucosa TaxID=3030827 RepID=A0ABT6FIU0_9BACT|nr:hypothetical protein [Paludisphaera mucosa]MDG3007503.1 hypothetical protein [Paludisphaera mucosa]
MQAIGAVAILGAVEVFWILSFRKRRAIWRRVRRLAEERQGGMVPLDIRTLVAIHEPQRSVPDELWFDAFLAYHLPAAAVVRLARGRFHVLDDGGWKPFAMIVVLTLASYSALAARLLAPRP